MIGLSSRPFEGMGACASILDLYGAAVAACPGAALSMPRRLACYMKVKPLYAQLRLRDPRLPELPALPLRLYTQPGAAAAALQGGPAGPHPPGLLCPAGASPGGGYTPAPAGSASLWAAPSHRVLPAVASPRAVGHCSAAGDGQADGGGDGSDTEYLWRGWAAAPAKQVSRTTALVHGEQLQG